MWVLLRSFLVFGVLLVSMGAARHDDPSAQVRVLRVPDGGMQPQAVLDDRGTLHLVYFKGDPSAGDLFYVTSGDLRTFSSPVRINSQPGSAVATGTIRGAQIALGRRGILHVAWNGSSQARPKGPEDPTMAGSPYTGTPMPYSRLVPGRETFEPQRNLITRTVGLDGGGSIAADGAGNVYVAWHARSRSEPSGETNRRVWLTHSSDDGAHFSAEEPINQRRTGACSCCGMALHATRDGHLYGLYRAATEKIHRDIYLFSAALPSTNPTFALTKLDEWQLNGCPMSSASIASFGDRAYGAWETRGQVFFARLDRTPGGRIVAAPGPAGMRKHPRLAVGTSRLLMCWTEGTGWNRGGGLAWQLLERSGTPIGPTHRLGAVPAWSFAAVVSETDGGFLLIY